MPPAFQKGQEPLAKPWSSEVKVGAVDCEENVNFELCTEQNIESVPTMKYFSSLRPGVDSDEDCRKIKRSFDIEPMRRALAKCLLKEIPTTKYDADGKSYGWALTSSSLLENVLVILDFSSQFSVPLFSRVDSTAKTMTVEDLQRREIILSGTPEVVHSRLAELSGSTVTPLPENEATVESSPSIQRHIHVYAADLFQSLTMMLFTDVPLRGDIHGEDIDALREFLHTLRLLLPASPVYHEKLAVLIEWLNEMESINGTHWLDHLRGINFPNYGGGFIGCLGSRKDLRRYPCGIWQIFHVLTVRHYELSSSGADLPPDIVAHAMNRFIPRFFSCSECAFHMAAFSANIPHAGESVIPQIRPKPSSFNYSYDPSTAKYLLPVPKSGRDEIIWLNKFHNMANVHLSGEPSDDPAFPKAVYPLRDVCPACWSEDANGTWVLGETKATQDALVDYLVSQYTFTSWRTDGVPTIFFDRSKPFLTKPPPVYAADVFKSLSMMLETDVSMRNTIDGEDIAALKEFLHMLCLLLPASSSYKQKLASLGDWVDSKATLTGLEWLSKLKEIKFPIYEGPFIECKGSQPHFRGYPCGLWLLFHSLTVRQYELTSAGSEMSPDLVAHAMNRFIPRFFSCNRCAFHFSANSANIARPGESILPKNRDPPIPEEFKWDPQIVHVLPSAPRTSEEQVLWLAAVHNRVNGRLSGSETDDPMAPKQVYPSQAQCPECWSDNFVGNSSAKVLGQTEKTRKSWLDFLVKRYSSASWHTKGISSDFFSEVPIEKSNLHLVVLAVISVALTLGAIIALIFLPRLVKRSLAEITATALYAQPAVSKALSDCYFTYTTLKFPLYDGPFIECKGSEPQYRGYPCGLWLLWHSLTVRQYELTRAGLVLPPDLVVHAMNRFMPRFFSCIECSYHFAAVTASLVRPGESILPRTRKPPSPEEFSWDPKCASMLLPSPGSSEEQVLFLSTIHNRVNLRLARTVTEDPKAPKQLYPTQSMCPSCWSDDPEDRGTQSMGNNPETRENWFNFLVNRYSSNSWQTDGVSTAFLSKDEDTRAEKCRPSLVLTSVGVTLFAMVGLVVLVLLLRSSKMLKWMKSSDLRETCSRTHQCMKVYVAGGKIMVTLPRIVCCPR
ncbi:unnamed protein product [Calicophoron daubneyi]|uniref:Sulfhydryl oxidase n=1 Tax=Calicophoron daubneyi TaxID=300641 RepID=A0AAV2TYM4_CALDB